MLEIAHKSMRPVVMVVVLVFAGASTALAQSRDDRAIVLENAPIMVMPDARTPLRVAAKGTSLVLLHDEGEWVQVQFQDPQWGLRTGYMQAKFVRIAIAALQPIDVSVPSRSTAPQTTTPRDTPPASPVQTPQAVGDSVRHAQSRNGFWFSGGMGIGSLGCDDCGGRANGLSGGISLGGTLSDKWLLGIGTTGWARTVVGDVLSVGTVDARIRFYPSLTSGFFITGGLGLGSVSFAGESEVGAGAVFGVGWDIRVGSNVSLTPFYNGFAMRSSLVDANVGQLGLGVTIH